MDKLEEDVFKEFKGLVTDMVLELKDAEKNKRGIDLSEFIEKLSNRYTSLNTAFRDAKTRKKDSKKGMFG